MKPEPRRRPPPPLSPASLLQAARRHLQRFWPSVGQMRRVLLRRVDRSLAFHGGERAPALAMVEALLADLVAEGALDDRRYARSWVEELHRKGVSRQAIRQRMRDKEVAPALVDQALETLAQDLVEPELQRAIAYARRRRLGPARSSGKTVEDPRRQREKDLAAMCRAGFAFGIARRVLDSEDLAALEAEAEGRPSLRP